MAVNPDISVLLDFYGEMLTEKERDMLEFYYNDDLSLKEIADNETAVRRMRRESGYGDSAERESITRQGVRDTIKRAEAKLLDMEERLHLVERYRSMQHSLSQIAERARLIEQSAINKGARDIAQNAAEIIAITSQMDDIS